MTYSQNLINFLKQTESYSETAYYDKGQYAIGYGHRDSTVRPGQRTSIQEAEQWLKQDIAAAVGCIQRNIKQSLTQGQFDALVSLAYNYGCTGFLRTEGGIAAKEGRFADVEMWLQNYKNAKEGGLEKRRKGELALFKGNAVHSAAPVTASSETSKSSKTEKFVLGLTIAATGAGLIYTIINLIKMVDFGNRSRK